jgi:signal peptidase II
MRFGHLWPYGLIVGISVAADQWIKYLVETRLEFQQPVDLLPYFMLFRTYNTGVAFSMFAFIGDNGLVVLALAVISFVLWLASRTTAAQWIARVGFALIVGGAIGNIIDRVAYGHVVDYILFQTPVWSFAVFNLADALITVGAVLVLIDEVLAWRIERRRVAPTDE